MSFEQGSNVDHHYSKQAEKMKENDYELICFLTFRENHLRKAALQTPKFYVIRQKEEYWMFHISLFNVCSQPLKFVFLFHKQAYNYDKTRIIIEPRRKKTGLRGFRPGPTQTGLYKLRKELDA